MPKLFMRLLRFLLLGLVFLVGGLAVVWTAGALYFDLPAPALLRTMAAIAWTLAAALFGTFFGWRGRVGVLFAFLLILGWWVTLTPRQDRDWQPSVAKLAYATREVGGAPIFEIADIVNGNVISFTSGVGQFRYRWLPIAILARSQGNPPSENQKKGKENANPSTPTKESSKQSSGQCPSDGGNSPQQRRRRQVKVKCAGRPDDSKTPDKENQTKQQKTKEAHGKLRHIPFPRYRSFEHHNFILASMASIASLYRTAKPSCLQTRCIAWFSRRICPKICSTPSCRPISSRSFMK